MKDKNESYGNKAYGSQQNPQQQGNKTGTNQKNPQQPGGGQAGRQGQQGGYTGGGFPRKEDRDTNK